MTEEKKDETPQDKEEVKEEEKVEEPKKEEPKKEEKVEEPKKEEKKEEKKDVKIPAKFKDLVSSIEKMSVIDLAELVKILEEKFGVSSQAPVAMAAPVAGGATGGAEEEEKNIFDVEITDAGSNKISVIKAIRTFVQIGLKEAKDLVDSAPKVLKEGVAKEEAEKMKKDLEEAGAKVTLK